MSLHVAGTWYVPEGDDCTIEFPALRDGNDPGQAVVTNDNGALVALVYVREADTDGLLLLKQYGAGDLVERLKAMEEWSDWEVPERDYRLSRSETGVYELEPLGPTEASDAM